MLISNPLIVPIEIGLLLVFLLHVYKADHELLAANRAARPVRLRRRRSCAGHTSRKSLASSTMICVRALVLLLFVVDPREAVQVRHAST